MAKKLKLVEIDGKRFAPVDAEGNPFLLADDGADAGTFDYQAAMRDNARLRGLSKEKDDWDSQRQTLADKAAAFERLGKSPEEVAEALKVVSGLKAKDLVEAKQVDALVAERVAEGLKQANERAQRLEDRANSLTSRVRNEKLKALFAESEKSGALANTNLIGETGMLMFGDHMDVVEAEDGSFEVIPYRDRARKEKFWNGEGRIASFEDALPEILKSHPRAKDFLKGVNGGGGGAPGGAKSTNGSKTLSRTQFLDMRPEQQMAHVQGGGEITD